MGVTITFGVKEKDFKAKLDEMVELAFDDQCTGATPCISSDGGHQTYLY